MSKKWGENLQDSKKHSTFASAYKQNDRDLAQLVAHTSGGREVAGSSPVIPTEEKSKLLIINDLGFFFCSFWRVFGVIMFFKPKIGHLNKDYQGKVRRTSR